MHSQDKETSLRFDKNFDTVFVSHEKREQYCLTSQGFFKK